MIRTFLHDPETSESVTGGEELLTRWRESDRSIIWLDMHSNDDAQDTQILSEFGIHPLAIQDALRPRHPPKTERFKEFLFVLLRGLEAETKGINTGTIQLACFIGSRFLITRHAKPSASANWLFTRLENDSSLVQNGPAALAVCLANKLARRYVEILLELEPRLDVLEEEMFKTPSDRLLAELTGYKSRLRKLTRTANYHRDVAMSLRSQNDSLIDQSLAHEIVDLYEQIERTQTLANMYYQICTDLTDGYLGMSSHRLNRVMQLLTIITVIFVPLTFMAGIYGMNFEYMPELSTRRGYFVLIGIMLAVAILQVIYFRRKRWL